MVCRQTSLPWADRYNRHLRDFLRLYPGLRDASRCLREAIDKNAGAHCHEFLAPLFFVYSGLNTSLSLVNSWLLWGMALLIFLAALGGKGAACWLAALLNGEPNREALAIGSLMNARGLMELILLNIGLQQGIITPTIFTMLVLMAIVTTLMASPIFEFVYGRYRAKAASPVSEPVDEAGVAYTTEVD